MVNSKNIKIKMRKRSLLPTVAIVTTAKYNDVM